MTHHGTPQGGGSIRDGLSQAGHVRTGGAVAHDDGTSFGAMDRVAVKLKQYLAPMDEGNGEKQVRSRSMNQDGHVMI